MKKVWRCISKCFFCCMLKSKQLNLNREQSGKKNLENEEKGHEEKSREIVYLPVITVDELAAHRKKRSALALPHDNLELPSGSFKHLKSEYTRKFKGFEEFLPRLKVIYAQKPQIPQPSLKLEGQQEYESEYDKSFGHELLSSPNLEQRPTEIIQKNHIQSKGSYKPRIFRRCTNLKLEGDFYHITTYAENFIRYLIERRERLKRKETNLKLTGDMEHETEFSRNFVPYENAVRPTLCKKFTNLHLSGSLNLETENRNNFLPLKVEKHIPLVKKPTNLHLEGMLFLEPEYRSAYIEYKHYEKQKPTLPINHFTAPLMFTDNQTNEHHIGSFTKSQLHPVIPFLREPYAPSRAGSRIGSRSGSRENSRPCSRAGSSPGSRDYSPQRSSSRSLHKAQQLRRGSADSIGRGGLMSISRSPTMPNLREKPARLKPLSMSMREPPKIRINDEDDRRFVRKDQRITYTKKLQPNLAPGLPPLPLDRGAKVSGIDGKASRKNKWRSAPQSLNQISASKSPDMEAAFDGRFECQPEYRKAYQNFLIRETKTKSLDRKLVRRDKATSEFSETSEFSPNNGSSSPQSKPPTPNTKIKKNMEKMETLAFGPRCRRESFSSHLSSSDGEIIAPQCKFKDEEKKRSPKFHYKHKMTIDVHPNMYTSDSEPSFVVVDKHF